MELCDRCPARTRVARTLNSQGGSRPTSYLPTADSELATIARLLNLLEPFSASARARVLSFVASWLDQELAQPPPRSGEISKSGRVAPELTVPEAAEETESISPAWFFVSAPPQDEGIVYANGIDMDSGMPLCQVNAAKAAEIAILSTIEDQRTEALAHQKRSKVSSSCFGTVGEVRDPGDLTQSGWGVVFPAGESRELRQALKPLLNHRRSQVLAEGGGGSLFRVFDGADGYCPGETCSQWLTRHRVGMSVVDPAYGVPFYLLLVGSPEQIPFEFQFLLDILWGVGRLHFETLEDYRRYAQSVVAYETATTVRQAKRTAIFSTAHSGDRATQMFADEVARPLAFGEHLGRLAKHPLGAQAGFGVEAFIGEDATKSHLTRLLRGQLTQGPPAVLLTGTHGLGFKNPDDQRIEELQGALICQDWDPWKPAAEEHWLAAGDLTGDAQIHGMIHFFFACFSAGWPKFESSVVQPGERPPRIAHRPLVAKLPQKMLTHPLGGSLAVVGHVDRAWSYSFRSSRAEPQLQGFRDVLERLLLGHRVGQATDQFDVRRAALSAELIELQKDLELGKDISDPEISSLWIARNDAQNYLVLGDPAVRLRVEDL